MVITLEDKQDTGKYGPSPNMLLNLSFATFLELLCNVIIEETIAYVYINL